jgi:hypothetical protein
MVIARYGYWVGRPESHHLLARIYFVEQHRSAINTLVVSAYETRAIAQPPASTEIKPIAGD